MTMTSPDDGTSRGRAIKLGVALFAAIVFPTAITAHAQLTLNSGDAVTVSGAGTVGIINGLPISNSTSSYSNGTGAGNFYAVETNGTATFALGAGGSLSGADLQTSTGNNGYGLDADGSGLVTISGGTITGGPNSGGMIAQGTGPVMISGGTIISGKNGNAALIAQQTGVATITGGTFTSGIGGQFISNGLLANFNGTINLFSLGDSPFLIDGVPMNNTSLTFYEAGTDTITGTLLTGNTLNTTFQVYSGGVINLNVGTAPTPEPSSLTALGLGTLFLVLRTRSKQKQHA